MARDTEADLAAIITALEDGRDNAISLAELAELVGGAGRSTLRRRIHELQRRGFAVLSSPRAGVWIAGDEGERIDVLDELRAQVAALEARMQLVTGGRCAWRECRAELDKATLRRGGLYCRGTDHRFRAAADRNRKGKP